MRRLYVRAAGWVEVQVPLVPQPRHLRGVPRDVPRWHVERQPGDASQEPHLAEGRGPQLRPARREGRAAVCPHRCRGEDRRGRAAGREEEEDQGEREFWESFGPSPERRRRRQREDGSEETAARNGETATAGTETATATAHGQRRGERDGHGSDSDRPACRSKHNPLTPTPSRTRARAAAARSSRSVAPGRIRSRSVPRWAEVEVACLPSCFRWCWVGP